MIIFPFSSSDLMESPWLMQSFALIFYKVPLWVIIIMCVKIINFGDSKTGRVCTARLLLIHLPNLIQKKL